MGTLEIIIRCVAGIVLVLVNAFFVAVEFALTRLRQFDRDELGESIAIDRAWEMTEELEFYLTGCQLGISLSSILLGVVTEPAFSALLAPLLTSFGLSEGATSTVSVVVAIFVIQLVHKIWGEQSPTYLGVERPVMVAKALAYPLWIWSKVMYPLIKAGDAIAKWTLRLFGVEMTRSWTEGPSAEEASGDGETRGVRQNLVEILSRARVPADRRDEIVAAWEIGERPISEIMVRREDVVVLDASKPTEENLDVVHSTPFNRFPLVDEEPDHIVGVVYLSSIVSRYDGLRCGAETFEELAQDPVIVAPGLSVADLIDTLQDERQELACVVDHDRLLGVVTVTDAFESIIGSLEDPLDPPEVPV